MKASETSRAKTRFIRTLLEDGMQSLTDTTYHQIDTAENLKIFPLFLVREGWEDPDPPGVGSGNFGLAGFVCLYRKEKTYERIPGGCRPRDSELRRMK
jgi:hypothetical protein